MKRIIFILFFFILLPLQLTSMQIAKKFQFTRLIDESPNKSSTETQFEVVLFTQVDTVRLVAGDSKLFVIGYHCPGTIYYTRSFDGRLPPLSHIPDMGTSTSQIKFELSTAKETPAGSYVFEIMYHFYEDQNSPAKCTWSQEYCIVVSSENENREKWYFAECGKSAIGTDNALYITSESLLRTPDFMLIALDPEGTEKWRIASPLFDNLSPPVIGANDIIYLSGKISNREYSLHAYNNNGTLYWKKTSQYALSAPCIDKNGLLHVASEDPQQPYQIFRADGLLHRVFVTEKTSNKPIVADNGWFYLTKNKLIYSYDHAGNHRWNYDCGSKKSNTDAIKVAILGPDGAIYLGTDREITALNTDGTERWIYAPYSEVTHIVMDVSGDLYIGCGYHILKLSQSGTLEWENDLGYRVRALVVGEDRNIYCNTSEGNIVTCFDPSGNKRWGHYLVGTSAHDLNMADDGTLYVDSNWHTYALRSDSHGLAQSPWPRVHQNQMNTGCVLPPLPDKAVQLVPANGDSNHSSNTPFEWLVAGNTVFTNLQISRDSLFYALVVDTTFFDTTAAIIKLAGESTYFWRIRGINVAGKGEWSDVWRFSTKIAVPVADFSATPLSGPMPMKVEFTSISTGAIDTYVWDFGDGEKGSGERVTHTYRVKGTYTVSLTVTGPGGTNTREYIDYLSVGNPIPTVDFSAEPSNGHLPLLVRFDNLSSDYATNWEWDFGDGTTDSTRSPVHLYNTQGIFTVRLTVKNESGSASKIKKDYIGVNEPVQDWLLQTTPTQENLFDVCIMDDGTGYCLGSNYTFYKTTDFGITWESMTISKAAQLRALFFFNADTGLVVGDAGTVYKTTNAGRTWRKINIGQSKNIYSIYFLDPQSGWMAGSDGIVLFSKNGGETWQLQASNIVTAFYAIFFIDTETGWACGSNWSYPPYSNLFHTTDGGKTWIPMADPVPTTLYNIFFFNKNDGWVQSRGNIYAKTNNGGEYWQPVDFGISNFINDFYLQDENNGWFVGTQGIILKTENGGASWKAEYSGCSSDLNSIAFSKSGIHGLIVGSNGTILVKNKADYPVPVEISSFKAILLNNEVRLEWMTLSESNNYGFEIEKSTNGESYQSIGFVKGSATYIVTSSYSFIDKSTQAEQFYTYRLKQIDNDGSYNYSQEVDISTSPIMEFRLNQNFPNPFNASTTINYALPGQSDVTLTIYNIKGAVVEKRSFPNQQAGNYAIELDAQSYVSGIYFYRLDRKSELGSNYAIKKFILIK